MREQHAYPANAGGGSYNYVQHPASPAPVFKSNISVAVCLLLSSVLKTKNGGVQCRWCIERS